RHVHVGLTTDRHQGALEAGAPRGGEELLRIGPLIGAVRLRAPELDIQHTVVADGVALAPAGHGDGRRIAWSDLCHTSSLCLQPISCRRSWDVLPIVAAAMRQRSPGRDLPA